MRNPVEPFPATIERFLAVKESENASPNTIRAYRADLIDLANYIGPKQPAETLSREIVRSFLAWTATRSLNKGTIKRRLYAIKSFTRWMQREELISEDTCEAIVGVHGPKLPENLPDIPSPEDIKRLLDGPFPTAFPERDRLLLELLYGAGLRVSEAARLTVDSFVPEQRAILIHGKGGMYGKDSKERLVPINPHMQKALNEYLPARARLLSQRKLETRALFFALNKGEGECVASRSVARILLRVTEVRGMQPLNPHRLRHACATHMLDNKCPLDVLKDLLGHDNINVTAMYCQVSTRLMMDSYKASHPYAVAAQKDGAA